MTRLLIIMGSGETAPTMIKPHRAIFDQIGAGSAVILDTPYGFQTNADDISTKAVGYFAASVGREVQIASWRNRDIAGIARERTLGALRAAEWIFAGPGSPTYVLRHWCDTGVPGLLADRLASHGAVVFASAAALTLGSHTVPVYEIYKAGVEPAWAEGLDLVRAATGLPAVVIPHYDNAEGGHHDTRFCYLGETRLSIMEAALPPESFIIGVDEHTAVVLDLDARTATVTGNGTMTIRQRGHSIVHPSGDVVPFDELTSGVVDAPLTDEIAEVVVAQAVDHDAASLRGDTDRIAAIFAGALESGDIDGCVEAILELEKVILDWSADTLTSDEGDHARATIRQMVVELGDLARSEHGSDKAIAHLMGVLLSIRRRARDAADFATSDAIRDELGALDIEVRDTPDGATWHRRN
jgi:cyanophycinase-like exopeptidase